MAGNSNQKLKLLRLMDILRSDTDEEHPLSASELCDKLAGYGIVAERKAVYSDIEILRDYGLDIVCTKTPKPGYFLAARDFETPEIYLLADAVQAAAFITPKKTKQLLKKLEAMLSVGQSRDIRRRVYIDNRGKCENEEIYYSIDVLARAIADGQRVELQYIHLGLPDGGRAVESYKELTVSPYAMTWANDRYYLVGNNAKYDNLMHLRIDRMRHVRETAEPVRPFSEVCEYKSFFDIADYTKKSFNMFGGEPSSVEFRCDNSLLEQIYDKFGRDIFIRDVRDGRFTFSAKALLSDGLASWILQFGDRIEVLSPSALAETVARMAVSTAALYGKK